MLYDDRAVYVGIRCFDANPAALAHPLGRRDSPPFSDSVAVIIDSNRDRRTAYYFELTAAGVQSDALLFGDDESNGDWDAVWDGAVTTDAGGWTAEFMIPLSVLRFSAAGDQTWGFGVKRVVARSHEESVSIPLKKSDRGIVARLAPLTGLNGLQPVQELSLAPYLAARLQVRPGGRRRPQAAPPRPLRSISASTCAPPRPRPGAAGHHQPGLRAGGGRHHPAEPLHLRALLPGEAPLLHAGARPLPGGPTPGDQPSPQQLFYSRRIGLDAPILGAVKLTGRLNDTLQVGLLDAVVAGAAAPVAPAHRPSWSPWTPLYLAPGDAYPEVAPARRNFLAATARWQPTPTVALGGAVTSAIPLDGKCTSAELDPVNAPPPAHCEVALANAASLNWSLHSGDDAWFLRGQLTGSQRLGGPPSETLADGTVLKRGDLGGGGFVTAGLEGGEPWRFDLTWEYEAPRLDLNALGYQRTQNEQKGRAVLRYVQPNGGGPFHSWDVNLGGETRFTTDGTGRQRGADLFLATKFQLRSFDYFGVNLNASADFDDVRELEQRKERVVALLGRKIKKI